MDYFLTAPKIPNIPYCVMESTTVKMVDWQKNIGKILNTVPESWESP
jgi:hypothetical protein